MHQKLKHLVAIGTALEQECQMRHYEREVPGLLNAIKKTIGTSHGYATEVRNRTYHDEPQRCSLEYVEQCQSCQAWRWLLDCVCDASGWFEKQLIRKGRKTTTHIVPTAAFMDIKDEVMANAAAFSAIAMPMLVPPKDWSQHEPGGYLLNEVMAGHDMVRRGNGTYTGRPTH